MNSRISVPLTASGIQNLIDMLDRKEAETKAKMTTFLDRVAQEGLQIASARFASGSTQYDGTKDVHVDVENRGENTRAVVAVGDTVLFLEFGTGIVYPDNHPEGWTNGMVRGSYGKGQGKNPSWVYVGNPGSNGQVLGTNKSGDTVVRTHGNPANMCMYLTVRDLETRVREIAAEVFR